MFPGLPAVRCLRYAKTDIYHVNDYVNRREEGPPTKGVHFAHAFLVLNKKFLRKHLGLLILQKDPLVQLETPLPHSFCLDRHN